MRGGKSICNQTYSCTNYTYTPPRKTPSTTALPTIPPPPTTTAPTTATAAVQVFRREKAPIPSICNWKDSSYVIKNSGGQSADFRQQAALGRQCSGYIVERSDNCGT